MPSLRSLLYFCMVVFGCLNLGTGIHLAMLNPDELPLLAALTDGLTYTLLGLLLIDVGFAGQRPGPMDYDRLVSARLVRRALSPILAIDESRSQTALGFLVGVALALLALVILR